MVIYAAHAIITEDECPVGYLLLRCIRLFLEVDMYASLEVHTTDTVCAGRHAVQAFSTYLQVCFQDFSPKIVNTTTAIYNSNGRREQQELELPEIAHECAYLR